MKDIKHLCDERHQIRVMKEIKHLHEKTSNICVMNYIKQLCDERKQTLCMMKDIKYLCDERQVFRLSITEYHVAQSTYPTLQSKHLIYSMKQPWIHFFKLS